MKSVKEHYDEMLGPVYSWILGDFENARDANSALFAKLDLTPESNATAVDLGSGPGCQAIPLAQLGYSVTAIDFCDGLLEELSSRANGMGIETKCDDILNFRKHVSNPELIVCMGDTLVHLPDMQSVDSLLDSIADALPVGGRFVASLRDYSLPALSGADRFIPVRSSDEQVFTCFLEYGDTVINVHDILHRKVGNDWQMTVSNYQKLMLDYRHVVDRLKARHLSVTDPLNLAGMMVIQATRAS